MAVRRFADRAFVHADAVGPHVGDVAGFVEALRRLHRARGVEAELARGFLLQRRGRERRRRIALGRLGFNRADLEVAVLDRVARGDAPSASFGMSRRLSFLPWKAERRAGKLSPRVRRRAVASTDQYSCGLNFSISTSRSTMMRSATDWTRPAEREPGSLRHSTGESVKPTR